VITVESVSRHLVEISYAAGKPSEYMSAVTYSVLSPCTRDPQEVSKVKACLDKIDQQNRSASSAVLGAMFQHEVKVSGYWV
jgi:hypothetical protein